MGEVDLNHVIFMELSFLLFVAVSIIFFTGFFNNSPVDYFFFVCFYINTTVLLLAIFMLSYSDVKDKLEFRHLIEAFPTILLFCLLMVMMWIGFNWIPESSIGGLT